MEWIGVDFDGTLVVYEEGSFPVIGAPIPKMIERVKEWLAQGRLVKIFTARVSVAGKPDDDVAEAQRRRVIAEEQRVLLMDWSETHLGQRLEVTCTKDYHMIELWDDRCKQMATNTGLCLEEYCEELVTKINFLLTTHNLLGPEGYTFPDGDHWEDPRNQPENEAV